MPPLRDVVQALAAREGVDAVVVVSADGLPIDHSTRNNGLDPDAVAALATSFVLGAKRLGQSAMLEGLTTGVLEFGDRIAIVAPVGNESVLFVLSAPGADIGQLLFDLRRHRPALAQLL